MEQLIRELGEDLGVTWDKLEKGHEIRLGPEMVIEIKNGKVVTVLGLCPEKRREELFILLMRANFLGQGTGGAAIGMSEDGNFLTLSLTLPYDIDYKSFKASIEEFSNFADYWKEQIARHKMES